jgi:hypothetical protein
MYFRAGRRGSDFGWHHQRGFTDFRLLGARDVRSRFSGHCAYVDPKYLNNIVEQDHRTIKRITRPMLGFKDFDCARYSRWHRDYVHDQQRADEVRQRNAAFCGQPVLLSRFLSNTYQSILLVHLTLLRQNTVCRWRAKYRRKRADMARCSCGVSSADDA